MYGDTFSDVLELHDAGLLRDDREGVGVPFDQRLARLDLLPVGHPQMSAVDNRVAFAVASLRVLHHERTGPIHDDE